MSDEVDYVAVITSDPQAFRNTVAIGQMSQARPTKYVHVQNECSARGYTFDLLIWAFPYPDDVEHLERIVRSQMKPVPRVQAKKGVRRG